jgi:hypothetical protein
MKNLIETAKTIPTIRAEEASEDLSEKSQDASEAVVGLDHKSRARNHAMFKWEDINKALMHVGMAPPNILKVSSALRGKEQ